jgi:hypothetical protein
MCHTNVVGSNVCELDILWVDEHDVGRGKKGNVLRTRDGVAIGFVTVFGVMALIELQVQHSHIQKPLVAPVTTSAAAPPPAPSKPQTAAEKRKEAIEERKEAAARAEIDETTRIAFAKTLEGNLLEDGMDATVTVYGPHHSTLQMKYILINKPTAYQITHDHQDWLNRMGSMGFNKFVITDGYESTWSWKLN